MFRFVNCDRNTTIVNCQITSKKPSARCLMAICVISALAILVYSYTLTTPCRLVKASQSFRRITFKTETLVWNVTLSPVWLAPSSLCLGCLFLTPEFHFHAELVQKGDFRNCQELSPMHRVSAYRVLTGVFLKRSTVLVNFSWSWRDKLLQVTLLV